MEIRRDKLWFNDGFAAENIQQVACHGPYSNKRHHVDTENESRHGSIGTILLSQIEGQQRQQSIEAQKQEEVACRDKPKVPS